MAADRRETDKSPAEWGGVCKTCGANREIRRYDATTEGGGPQYQVVNSCPSCGDETTTYVEGKLFR